MVKELSRDSDRVTVELMTENDIDRVMEIERDSFPAPWSRAAYTNELRNPSAIYVVARLGSEVVGFAGVWVVADEAHVTTIAVDRDCRRRGLGSRIFAELIGRASERGAGRVTLEVRPSNHGALEMYRKFGLYPAGIRRAYYADNGEDAWVLWLDSIEDESFRAACEEALG
jgi:ribosomal-protein-alanine N-acetyltransferase